MAKKRKSISTTTTQMQSNSYSTNNIRDKFVNLLMVAGKKSRAKRIFTQALNQFFGMVKLKNNESLASKSPSPSQQDPTQPQVKKVRLGKVEPTLAGQAGRKQGLNLLERSQPYKSKRLDFSQSKSKTNSIQLELKTLIKNVTPHIHLKKSRQSATLKLIPAISSYRTGQSRAMRWIIESAKKKNKTSRLDMSHSLAQEFFDAYHKQGWPYERKIELYKASSTNLSNLAYKWW